MKLNINAHLRSGSMTAILLTSGATTITDLDQATPLGKSHGRGFPDRIARLAVALFLVGVSTLSMAGQDVPTFHNDRARSGIQRRETSLTPSNVNTKRFGKLRSFGVDADVYAQPLYISKYKMADGQLHNVLFVVTAQQFGPENLVHDSFLKAWLDLGP